MSGKALGPIKCKVCEGEHQGTICRKFNTVRVIEPKPRVAALLPSPKKAKRKASAK